MAANAQELPQQYDGTLQSTGLPADTGHEVYREALRCLLKAKVPFLVGGALALESYTGRARRTKDLDLFVNPADRLRLMQRLPQFTHVPLLATEPSPARTRLAEAGSRSKAMNPPS